MVNLIHYLLHSPRAGWDPIPADYAAGYAKSQWSVFSEVEFERIVAMVGGVNGKTVLDIGAGPGQFAVSFAKRGAQVTWYDISENYRKIAEKSAAEHGIAMEYAVGYIDDAVKNLAGKQFDVVFCRGCWNYSLNDSRFAGVLWALTAPGGSCYADVVTSRHGWGRLSLSGKARTWLYEQTGIKIGHPFIPKRRAMLWVAALPLATMQVDCRQAENDRILFTKPLTGSNSSR